MGRHIYTIGRQEIIRGFKSFEKILDNSWRIETENLSAFIGLAERTAGFPVKVGFLVSKKKLENLMTEIG